MLNLLSAGAFTLLALYGLFFLVMRFIAAPLRGREVEYHVFWLGVGASWVVLMVALVILWRRGRWLAIVMPVIWFAVIGLLTWLLGGAVATMFGPR